MEITQKKQRQKHQKITTKTTKIKSENAYNKSKLKNINKYYNSIQIIQQKIYIM